MKKLILLTAMIVLLAGCISSGPKPTLIFQLENIEQVDVQNPEKLGISYVIVDPWHWDAAKVSAVKNFTTPIAYLSVGRAQVSKEYYSNISQADWIEPVQGDYAHVKYWNEDWQQVAAGEIRSIIALNYSGVLMDNIDAYNYWTGKNLLRSKERMSDFMLALISYAKELDPNFLVLARDGHDLLSDPAYLDAIDGVMKENVWHTGTFINNHRKVTEAEELLDTVKRSGKIAMAVDYTSNKQFACESYARAEEKGYYVYVAPENLDTVQWYSCTQNQTLTGAVIGFFK